MKRKEDYFKEEQKNSQLAKQQHEIQRQKFREDVEDLTNEQKRIADFRIQTGEVDYSLFNYILTVHDFSKCSDASESLFQFYRYIYHHMVDLQRSNEGLRGLCEQMLPHMNRAQRKIFDKDLDKKSPFQMAQDFGKEIQKRAKKRSEAGIKSYTLDDAKKMGIKI